MKMFDSYLIIAATTLITIVNPLGAVGPFLAMTADNSDFDTDGSGGVEASVNQSRARVARQASFVAFGILVLSAAAGSLVFKFFGISLPALKISGGLLLFLIAIDMLSARTSRMKSTKEENDEGVQKEDIAIFPLAIPLLSGPGSIGSVFMLMDQAQTFASQMSVYAAIALAMFSSYVCLRQAHRISKLLGRIGMNVMTRLMGLVLAAIAMQFMIDGLLMALPGLGVRE